MSEPFYLLLGIHNHQPVGNFEHIFAQAFEQCYWPLIRLLEKYPAVRIALHHSGPLLDWAMDHEPAYIPTLVGLCGRGQVEILSGGYYEPILPILKPADARGQIAMMQDFWTRATGKAPQGMWVAERVWEPGLAATIADAGFSYTILDDEHFRYAGMPDETLFDFYRTERAGRSVAVFPTDKTMRYLIPFKPVEDVIAHLTSLRKRYPGHAITYGDDGEKFGMWPGTFEWVIKKGWLEKFFKALSELSDEIVTMPFSHFLESHKARGTVYLPTASYNEMLEWAMPAESIVCYETVKKRIEEAGIMDQARPFLRGGLWDNFLAKYPESNMMHKKAIYISDRIDEAEGNQTLSQARRSLYRAQCNCAYWHGLFGGLYLNYLRHAVYENLIAAENAVDAQTFGDEPFFRLDTADVDGDGLTESVMASDHILATVSRVGGTLTEFAWRPARLNMQNTLARRFEAYHRPSTPPSQDKAQDVPSIHDISKDIGSVQGDLVYDEFPRHSFIERLFPAKAIEEVIKESAKPATAIGRTLFELASSTRYADAVVTHLVARLPDNLGTGHKLTIEKVFRLERSRLAVDIDIAGMGDDPFVLMTELNLTLLAGHDPSRYYLWGDIKPGSVLMDAKKTLSEMSELILVDEAFGLTATITASSPATWKLEPIETVSQSESGFDRLYQGSSIQLYTTNSHFSVSILLNHR